MIQFFFLSICRSIFVLLFFRVCGRSIWAQSTSSSWWRIICKTSFPCDSWRLKWMCFERIIQFQWSFNTHSWASSNDLACSNRLHPIPGMLTISGITSRTKIHHRLPPTAYKPSQRPWRVRSNVAQDYHLTAAGRWAEVGWGYQVGKHQELSAEETSLYSEK